MNRAFANLSSADVDALLKWYSLNRREFPWRADPNPYWVWLAEIMSQQTTMTALLPYFRRFIEKFPDVESLAAADEAQVLAAWAGLGYYSRARNVQRAAQKIVGERGGKFPKTYLEWLDLPGVGPYTAAAVVSQCFGVEEPVWDGNVLRVSSRVSASRHAHESAFKAEALTQLRGLMARRDASAFNQALMELGATVCSPKSPSCGRCPIEGACVARAKDRVGEFPPPKRRPETVEISCRVQVRLRTKGQGFEAYLAPREIGRWFHGLWDFPSELGGAEQPCMIFKKIDGSKRGQARHQITKHRITLEAYVSVERNAATRGAADGRWLDLDDLTRDEPSVALSTTAKKILKSVLRELPLDSIKTLV